MASFFLKPLRAIRLPLYCRPCLALIFIAMGTLLAKANMPETRQVISLDGVWQIEQGNTESAPKEFSHTVVVPGLVDMAQPSFAEVGKKSELREAFWYRRSFSIEENVPDIAILKIHKAKWGMKAFLNGQLVGEHLPCFTPAILNVKPYLKGNGKTNELLIRVGADRESLPEGVPNGWDFEKNLYIPGIYDSVELILTDAPYVVNIQTVPDVPNKRVRVVAEIQAGSQSCETTPKVEVREAASGKVVGETLASSLKLSAGELRKIDVTIPLPDCRLWSPEDPFLYMVAVDTNADSLTARFGMRSFRCDPESGRMILNGKPYFMRGTNVTIYRFFEDAQRGDLPWRSDWVRKLHQKYKGMNWNSIRYCIGFPPDFWYDIADEEGFLIQDEFPIWLDMCNPTVTDKPKADKISRQYTEWMRERWNHPCVVIWDAQNESISPEIGKAIAAVRESDLSNRPWDNGYEGAPTKADCMEAHPYLFCRWHRDKSFFLRELAGPSISLRLKKTQIQRMPAPIIINEYDWLWLNRDGSPTRLSKKCYQGLLGTNSTVEQRRMLHARYAAALTEFWRCHRKVAGVLHFCGLGYSRDSERGGATSDNFIDVKNIVFEPLFEKYVRDAFAPVGLMIDAWAEQYPPGPQEFPVIVINDLDKAWKGTVQLRLLRDGESVTESTQPCEVSALGDRKLKFTLNIPSLPGRYQIEASLLAPNEPPVRSLRDFEIPATETK